MSQCQTKLSWISFQRRRIVLYASKLAGCANMHKYLSQDELGQQLDCYLGRNADYRSLEEVAAERAKLLTGEAQDALRALKSAAFETEKEVTDALADAKRTLVDAPLRAIEDVSRAVAETRDLLARCPEARKALAGEEDAADLPEPLAREVTALKELRARVVDPQLSALLDRPEEDVDVERLRAERVVPAEAVEVLASAMFTAHGTRREDAIRETFQSSAGVRVDTCADFFVSKRPLFHVDGVPVFVGGRHDGIDATDGSIVEIKTRQRRFLGTPLYETVQVHAYMFMHDVRNATIVESFQGKEKVHPIEFDERLWAAVCERTEAFLTKHLSQKYKNLS